jgi:gluconate 2-dehydrogenase gamma chain
VSHHQRQSDLDLSRRDALKIAVSVGAAAMIPLVPVEVAEAAQKAVASGKPVALKFFTAAQHRTVDALTEVIIPTDERSPGARAAKVANYLDFILNEASAEAKQAWQDGLTAVDAASTAQFSKPFADLTSEQQVAIVTEAAKDEQNPTTPLAQFFREAKGRTIHGYYTSEIGIHQELKYKGNQFLPEFVGCDHPEHMS